ncbi:MAG TPA: HAD-IA family hydrolase [Dehalococcoidia bacterium]|nr:HAD-IA family hydrolase [Dehalococcoidia bacterium]
MIKAVFFDWFNTLTHFEPPRAELYSWAFQQFGIELAPKVIMRGILAADRYYFEESAKSPVEKRSPEEQVEVYSHYPKAILAEEGIKVAEELPLKILKIVQQQFKGDALILFDDVLSTLKTLKERRLILGLLTNATKDKLSLHRKLGLEGYLDFVVTSQEAGADKPKPPIFLAALDRAGVEAFEALHVGDQYQLDVVGARGVGINPILIDRCDLYPEVSNCPRIRSLTELAQHLG